MGNGANDPTHNEIPRSIETGSVKETIGTHVPQQQQRASPQNVQPQQQGQRSRQHRRTLSEDFQQRTHEQLYYQQMAPPLVYNNMQHPGGQQQMPMPSPRRGQGAPQQQQPMSRHNRSRSWNPPPEVINAAYGFSPAGNPLIPGLQEQQPGGYSGRRKRSFSNASDTPPPPPAAPQQQQSQRNAGSWSPRTEIMGLTKGMSNRRTPPVSPNNNRGTANYRTMSPRISPNAALRTATRSEMMAVHVNFSAGTNMDHPFSATSSVRGLQPWQHYDEMDALLATPPSVGGEAVFDAQRQSTRFNRKMHMRQRSAQLFMEDFKGTEQRPACRDVLFVLLFLFHLVGMAFLGTTYGHEAMIVYDDDITTDSISLSYWNIIAVASICGAFAVLISTCTLILMMAITKRIVQLALILTICLSFAWGTIGIGVSPKNFVPITGIIALALSVAYAFVVWDRIPFAAANLHAGLSAVRANLGTVLVAFCFQAIALAWTVYYTFVLIGVYDALEVGDLTLSHNMTIFVYCMLGISYYWTFQVLMNVIQVTVSGTIGKWWFQPATSESPLWSESVGHSIFSAIFYSSGSICFGSLLIGPVHLLRQLSAFFRPAQQNSILMCLHEFVNCIQQCIANCVDNLSDHFNPWALTYVGLYGYGLLDAGPKATELFEKRGWTRIVSDDLVTNVLLMFSVVVGGVTGSVGILIQQIDALNLTNFDHPTLTAFGIGVVVGLVLTSVLFSIISASVNAVIVCFAGSPLEFESNHPQLSAEMRSAWREVWPGCMDVVDLRVGIMTGTPIGTPVL